MKGQVIQGALWPLLCHSRVTFDPILDYILVGPVNRLIGGILRLNPGLDAEIKVVSYNSLNQEKK